MNCALVTKNKTDKSAIGDFGSPGEFLKSIGFYLGEQSYEGRERIFFSSQNIHAYEDHQNGCITPPRGDLWGIFWLPSLVYKILIKCKIWKRTSQILNQ